MTETTNKHADLISGAGADDSTSTCDDLADLGDIGDEMATKVRSRQTAALGAKRGKLSKKIDSLKMVRPEFWKALKIPDEASKPHTYEADDENVLDDGDRMVQCGCPLANCRCITPVPISDKVARMCPACANKECQNPCACKTEYPTFKCINVTYVAQCILK